MIKLKDILNEGRDPRVAELRKIMKNIRKYESPYSVIVIQNHKVIKQEIDIKDYRLIPAYYRELAKKYPNAVLRVEDNQGLGVINNDYHIPPNIK